VFIRQTVPDWHWNLPIVHARFHKNYLLTILLLILAFNYMDRLVLGVLLQDIKTDLALSDTDLGFLTGIAFALFYAIMGIPIARWADRGNRITIVSIAAALWSVAVALCGAAANFFQLLLIRVGVAVGEAGCYPPALPLISEYFTRAERPRAIAVYMLGWPLALVIGNFAAGWLNEFFGWRATFVILALPGLVLAVIAALTLKEPRRMSPEMRAQMLPQEEVERPVQQAPPSLLEVGRTLWGNTAYRHLLLCFSVWSFFGYGIFQWQPAFFMRSHGLETGELGTWLAVVYGGGGLLGTWLGGEVATRYAANDERLQLIGMAVLFVFFSVLTAGAYLVADYRVAFAILSISSIGGAAINGPLFAATQTLVEPRMRSTAIALMFLLCNLIGMGLGPLAAGALSDALRPTLGEESLRWSLLAFCPGYFWAAWHALRASRTARAIAARIAEGHPTPRRPGKTELAQAHRDELLVRPVAE
jgi:predicted MFS family arabinose efflux permease